MLGDDVAALIHQSLGRIAFFRRIVPGIGHDELQLGLRIHRLHAEHEGVHPLDDFRHRDRAHVTGSAGLGQRARDDALHIPRLIEADVVGRNIRITLVAGCVLEIDIREALGRLEHVVHVTERRGEDQLVAGRRQIGEHLFAVRTFRHVFDEGGLDGIAEFFHGSLAGGIVLVSPTKIAHRAEIDKANLQRISCQRLPGQTRHGSQCSPGTKKPGKTATMHQIPP